MVVRIGLLTSVLAFPTLALAADLPLVVAQPGKGITWTNAEQTFSMSLRGRVQLRETVVVPAADDDGLRPVTKLTQLKTARVILAGYTLSPDVKYLVQLALAPADFREGMTSPVFDAYIDYTKNPNLSLKVGQYLVPFDRARTIREATFQLPDRSRPVSELTLDRDIGVTVYSDRVGGEKSPVAYRAGVFSGSGIGQVTAKSPGALAVGRIELRPLGAVDDDSEGDLERREALGLAIGVGAAYNLNTTRQRGTTSTYFTGGTADYLHLDADVVVKWRGAAVLAEVLVRDANTDAIRSTGSDGEEIVETTRSGYGFVIQPSYAFTPHFELAARYAQLYAFEGTDPKFIDDVANKGHEVVGGANWYISGHRFKVQADWGAVFGESVARAEQTIHAQIDVSF